jgi:hypothetical protein
LPHLVVPSSPRFSSPSKGAFPALLLEMPLLFPEQCPSSRLYFVRKVSLQGHLTQLSLETQPHSEGGMASLELDVCA